MVVKLLETRKERGVLKLDYRFVDKAKSERNSIGVELSI